MKYDLKMVFKELNNLQENSQTCRNFHNYFISNYKVKNYNIQEHRHNRIK